MANNVALIFGGKSLEHNVSLNSAFNVLKEIIDNQEYNFLPISIDRDGNWFLFNKRDFPNFYKNYEDIKKIELNYKMAKPILVTKEGDKFYLTSTDNLHKIEEAHIFWPLVHGEQGEDGSLAGYFETIGAPYIGCNLSASYSCFNKAITKSLLEKMGFEVAPYLLYPSINKDISFSTISRYLGSPFFVKPATGGSSIGITKVKEASQLNTAIEYAKQSSNLLIFEQVINGRELECAILEDNKEIKASKLGEIIVQDSAEFYDYNAKYSDTSLCILKAPADINDEVSNKAQLMAKKVFQQLGCSGYARVDMFYTNEDKIIINEVNTVPGFTKISMYPTLWIKSGIKYKDLIIKLLKTI